MATTIRVGMVGVTPSRGFSSIAHMPALQALPDFEVVAVCTTRQETAEAAAKHYGVPLAFADPVQLAQHPDVDLVTVASGARPLHAGHGRDRRGQARSIPGMAARSQHRGGQADA